jgi:hypothetical protein
MVAAGRDQGNGGHGVILTSRAPAVTTTGVGGR